MTSEDSLKRLKSLTASNLFKSSWISFSKIQNLSMDV